MSFHIASLVSDIYQFHMDNFAMVISQIHVFSTSLQGIGEQEPRAHWCTSISPLASTVTGIWFMIKAIS